MKTFFKLVIPFFSFLIFTEVMGSEILHPLCPSIGKPGQDVVTEYEESCEPNFNDKGYKKATD